MHFTKDVGQIPFLLQRDKGYLSKILVSSKSYPLQKEIIIPFNGKRFLLYFNALIFIVLNAKKINVLNLYHYTRLSLFVGLVYKFFNRKGVVFLKADFAPVKNQNETQQLKKGYLLKQFNKKLDILLVEHNYGFNYFSQQSTISSKTKIICGKNGVDEQYNKIEVNYSRKENVIVYAGRVNIRIKRVIFC
jgi:L-malate glycosyltransferase